MNPKSTSHKEQDDSKDPEVCSNSRDEVGVTGEAGSEPNQARPHLGQLDTTPPQNPSVQSHGDSKSNHTVNQVWTKRTRKVSFNDEVEESDEEQGHQTGSSSSTEHGTPATSGLYEDNTGVPYDRGWAWMVDLGCFVLFFVYITHDHWHSVLLSDYLQQFEISVSRVTILLSLGSVCYCLATQISTNVLVTRFSIRVVLTTAAILNVCATLLFVAFPTFGCFFVVNLIKYTVKGFTLIASMILVGYYFRRRRALATTLSLLGVSSSFMCGPPLVRYLRDEFGFRGCFLIMAGLEMHGIVAALLLRPISSYKGARITRPAPVEMKEIQSPLFADHTEEHLDSSQNKLSEDLQGYLHQPSSKITEDTIIEADEVSSGPDDQQDTKMLEPSGKNILSAEIRNHIDLKKNLNYVSEDVKDLQESAQHLVEENDSQHSDGDHDHIDEENQRITSSPSEKVSNHRMYTSTSEANHTFRRKRSRSDSYSGELRVTKASNASNWSLVTSSTIGSMLNIAHGVEPELSTSAGRKKKRQTWSWVRDFLDVSILKNYLALTIALTYIMVNAGAFTVTYLPTHARLVGVSPQNSAVLLTVIGSMDMIGRLAFGFLADLNLLRPNYIVALACGLIGIVTQFIELFDSFEKLVVFSVAHGLLGGVGSNLLTVLIVDVLGLQHMAKLTSVSSMFNSFSFIIQHPVQGAIIEATGSFFATFHYVGSSFIFAALLLLCEPFIRRLQAAKEKKAKSVETKEQLLTSYVS